MSPNRSVVVADARFPTGVRLQFIDKKYWKSSQWCFLLSLANNMIALSDLFSFYFLKWENIFKVIPSRKLCMWQFNWNCIIELRRFYFGIFRRGKLDLICFEFYQAESNMRECILCLLWMNLLEIFLLRMLHVHDVVLFICYSNIFITIFQMHACVFKYILIRDNERQCWVKLLFFRMSLKTFWRGCCFENKIWLWLLLIKIWDNGK